MALFFKLFVMLSVVFGSCNAFLFTNPISMVTNVLKANWLLDLMGLDKEQKERMHSAVDWISKATGMHVFGMQWHQFAYHSVMDHYTSVYEGQKAQIADYCPTICDSRNCLNKEDEESVLQAVLHCKDARYSENGQDGTCSADHSHHTFVIEWYRVEGFIEVERVWKRECPSEWQQNMETRAFCVEECNLKEKKEL